MTVIRDRTKRMSITAMKADIGEMFPNSGARQFRWYDRDTDMGQNTMPFSVDLGNNTNSYIYYAGNLIVRVENGGEYITMNSYRNKNRTTLKRINQGIRFLKSVSFEVESSNGMWTFNHPSFNRKVVFFDGMRISFYNSDASRVISSKLEEFNKAELRQYRSVSMMNTYCDMVERRLKEGGKEFKPEQAKEELMADPEYLNRVVVNESWSDSLLGLAWNSEKARSTRVSGYTFSGEAVLLMRLRRFLKRFYNMPIH